MKFVFALGFWLLSIFNVSAYMTSAPRHEALGKMLFYKLVYTIRNTNVDLILMMDNSASVTKAGYKKARQASQDVVEVARSLANDVRVGVIAFSDPQVTGVRFSLGTYKTLKQVKRRIGRLAFDAGKTRATDKALKSASVEYQTSPAGRKKLLWLYTDGLSNRNPIPYAARLKNSDVTIYVMVVNPNKNSSLLSQVNDIASDGCVYEFQNFKMYRDAMEFAATKIRIPKSKPVGASLNHALHK